MKRSIIILALLTASLQAFTQEPTQATKTECLLNVMVRSLSGEPHVGDFVSFTGKTSGKTFSGYTGDNGNFRILIPKEEVYEVSYKTFEKDQNYADLEIPEFDGYLNYDFTIKYDMPKVVTLDNVYFDTGKATLKPESFPSLNNLAELLVHKKLIRIEISGHTDNVGSDASNQTLSENRAKSVRSYVIKKGVAGDRIEAIGFGESRPINSNETPEGRQQNRRTEVRIL